MYGIVLEYRTGCLIEAVVLRLTADGMRVVPRGCRDAVELRRIGAEWINEAGEAIALGLPGRYVHDYRGQPIRRFYVDVS
jgi:hypothetical protein